MGALWKVLDPRARSILVQLSKSPKKAGSLIPKYCYGEIKEIPRSTFYRLLKRLNEMGLVEILEGVDKRYRFYVLTEKGEELKEELLGALLSTLKARSNVVFINFKQLRVVDVETFKATSCKFGIPPSIAFKALGLKKIDSYIAL